VPVGAYAQLSGGEILLMGMYVDDSGNVQTGKTSGDADKAQFLGESLAKQLKARSNGR